MPACLDTRSPYVTMNPRSIAYCFGCERAVAAQTDGRWRGGRVAVLLCTAPACLDTRSSYVTMNPRSHQLAYVAAVKHPVKLYVRYALVCARLCRLKVFYECRNAEHSAAARDCLAVLYRRPCVEHGYVLRDVFKGYFLALFVMLGIAAACRDYAHARVV